MNKVDVFYRDIRVGRLFEDSHGRICFSYDPSWLKSGFSISPFSLPLSEETFVADPLKFEGLFGVFHDSLPDGWGTLTAAKALRKRGIDYLALPVLERLCYLGEDGLGALRYRPSYESLASAKEGDYDAIAMSMMAIVEDKDADYDAVFALAGSTGGARPKAHMRIDGEDWIVKFRQMNDPLWMGRMEYEYALAAKEAGLTVSRSRLLPSKLCQGYFATKRFDRTGDAPRHVLSLAALLETPHDRPFLDYAVYLQATKALTKSTKETLEAFRLACFNAFAQNRDDHAKNFAFVYDEAKGDYVSAPSYDLTFVPDRREHEMTCMGIGEPGEGELRMLYRKLGLPRKECEAVIEKVRDVVSSRLGEWVKR